MEASLIIIYLLFSAGTYQLRKSGFQWEVTFALQ